MQPRKPTRRDILSDFRRHAALGDPAFQFERAVRRWVKCGYPAAELPHLFSITPGQLEAALEKAAQE